MFALTLGSLSGDVFCTTFDIPASSAVIRSPSSSYAARLAFALWKHVQYLEYQRLLETVLDAFLT
jgi:hypothetical protein